MKKISKICNFRKYQWITNHFYCNFVLNKKKIIILNFSNKWTMIVPKHEQFYYWPAVWQCLDNMIDHWPTHFHLFVFIVNGIISIYFMYIYIHIKMRHIFMTISGLAESFKTMKRPSPTVTLFDDLFIENYKI